MVSGINTNVEYGDEVYHVQTEDCGLSRPMLKTVVFFEGGAVATVETSYAKLARSSKFSEQEVARRLTAQHWKTAADLRNGRLYLDVSRRQRVRRASDRGETTPAEASKADASSKAKSAGTKESDEAAETKRDAGGPATLPGDDRPRPPMSDRRVTMLSIALAAVSITLAVFTVLSLIPLSGRTRRIVTDNPTVVNRPVPLPTSTATDDPPVCAVMADEEDAPSSVAPAALSQSSRPDTTSTPPAARAVPTGPAKAEPPAPRPKKRLDSGPAQAAAPARTPRTAPPMPEPEPAVEAAPVEVAAEERHDAVASNIVPPPPVTPVDLDPTPQLPAEPVMKEQPVAPVVDEVPVGPFDLADVDIPPRLTSQEMPTYTKRARRKGQEGTVGLNLLIDERGVIVDLRLKQTIPDSDLNEAVLDIIRSWRFDPARRAGAPVSVWKPVTIEFSIIGGQRRVRFLE
jgi:protein TonB